MWIVEVSDDEPVGVNNLRFGHDKIYDGQYPGPRGDPSYMDFCVFEHNEWKIFRFMEDNDCWVVAIGYEGENGKAEVESLLLFCENFVGICDNWVELYSQAIIALG